MSVHSDYSVSERDRERAMVGEMCDIVIVRKCYPGKIAATGLLYVYKYM